MYYLLKGIVRVALRVFFRKIHVFGREAVPAGGPLLVAANHPNTFMDPLLIAAYLRQPVYFLANGALFRNPLAAWVLRGLHLIPIYRRQDVSAGQKPDNTATFARCFAFLRRQGTLLIFPEGTSEHERRLRPLKTGTARIALGAEAENSFALGVHILPVGLTYTDPQRFQSEVFVHFAPPLDVRTYRQAYETDASAATDQLTEHLRQRLEAHTVITSSPEHDLLVRNIEKLYKTRLLDELNLTPDPAREDLLITQGIAEAATYFETHEPYRFAEVKQRLQSYANRLERLGLDEETLARENQWFHRLRRGLVLVAGFPFWLYGLVFNYLPYILPSRLAPLITRDVTYRAPLLLSLGVVTFTAFYTAFVAVFWQWCGGWLATGLFAASLPASGMFAWYYALLAGNAWESRAFRRLSQRRKTLTNSLLTERHALLHLLESAKADYLAKETGPTD